MTADVELLPLPELPEKECDEMGCEWIESQIEAYATDYARANVAHHVAAKDYALADAARSLKAARAARDAAEVRAERLAEALRDASDALKVAVLPGNAKNFRAIADAAIRQATEGDKA